MSSRSMTCKQASGGHPQDDNEDNQNACSAVVALQKVGHLDQFPFIENPVPPPALLNNSQQGNQATRRSEWLRDMTGKQASRRTCGMVRIGSR